MRKLLKQTITAILAAAILISGATFDSMTAEAKMTAGYKKDRTGMEDANDIANTTITMKIGDTKKVDIQKAYGSNNQYKYDQTNAYAWASSDESVVSMQREWVTSASGEHAQLSYVTIKAEKPGTAVINAVADVTGETVSFTVTVEQPKVTAKQKKCRHSWKTTKKATCLESGMKTCKKCKLQKVVAKKEHTLEAQQEERYDYTYYIVYQCGACTNEDPVVREYHMSNAGFEECEDWCEEEFSQLDYGSAEAAREACSRHKTECKHGTGVTKYIQVPYKQKITYKDVNVCTSCGCSEMMLDLIFNVNDPSNPIFIKDM